MICPRRSEPFGTPAKEEDRWILRDGHHTCSYCGSLSTEEFFAAIDKGEELGPTDKSYKVYVDLPHPDGGKPCILTSANFRPGWGEWVQVCELSRGFLPDGAKGHKDGDWVQVTPRPPRVQAKFYFQHLSRDEMGRFIDLCIDRKIKVGIPGHFYVLPFFMTPSAQT